ncbi:MAG: response regulator [Alphaproteobacteria bacterium]
MSPPAQPAADAQLRTPVLPVPEGRPARVLLAEDNHINQKVILAVLKQLDAETDLVENGVDAVTALVQSDYYLILMDIHMPRMSGSRRRPESGTLAVRKRMSRLSR